MEVSTANPPSEGLPAEFLFAPRSTHRDGSAPGVGEVLDWCVANLGPGVDIGICDDLVLGPDQPWGFWPGGAVCIRAAHHAVWFKMVWC